jgi:hypothetical protein
MICSFLHLLRIGYAFYVCYSFVTHDMQNIVTHDTQMIRIGYAFDTLMVRKRYATATHGTHLLRTRYAYGTQMLRIWYAHSTHDTHLLRI